MSVLSMGALAASPPATPARAAETPGEKNLRLVVTYIPSEAIALYLLFLGGLLAFPGNEANAPMLRWVSFAVGLVSGIGLAYLTFKPGTDDTPATKRSKQIKLMLFAAVAFFAYSVATPGGPWQGAILGVSLTFWGSLLAAVLAVFLPLLAGRWGLRPATPGE